jgi:putative DNA primase/helicase
MLTQNNERGNADVPPRGATNRSASGARPDALPVREESIPACMKREMRWGIWRYEPRKGADGATKWTKPPIDPATGGRASVNNLETWGAYPDAHYAYRTGTYDGMGVVFTAEDDYIGIDLDECRQPATGQIAPAAMAVVRDIDSYTEISPSGTGLKIFAKGRLPGVGGKRGRKEVYDRERYFTVTGHHLDCTPGTVNERTEAVAAFYAEHFGKRPATPTVSTPRNPEMDVDGQAALARAFPRMEQYQRNLANGADVNRFGKEYKSGSEADMALICALVQAGLDGEEVFAAFFASARGRMAVDRYGDDDAERRIRRSIEEAHGWVEERREESPLPVLPNTKASAATAQRTNEALTEAVFDDAVTARRRRFPLLTGDAILRQPRPRFLIDDMLVEETLSAMIGKEGTFKSFIALDLALRIATGTPFHGRAVRQGHAVYVAAEGMGGIGKRAAAWAASHQCAIPACFHLLPESVRLLERGDVQGVLDTLHPLPESPTLLVVDTLARAIEGGDENSAKDMGALIAAADILRTRLRCHVLLIHHENKSGGARGSTSLLGAIDTRIDVHRGGEFVTLQCGKQKDYDRFADITLARRVVEIPSGDTSLVFQHVEAAAASPTDIMARAEDVLRSLGAAGATATEWERACRARGIGSGTFYKAKRELVEAGVVTAARVGRGARFTVTGEGG